MVQFVEQNKMFCYNYIDKFKRLDKTALAPREQLYNWFAGKHCSEPDNARAQRVWRDFKFQHIGDYMQFYLMSDIARFVDVFKMFRYNSVDEYQLDPAYYMSAP